MNQAIKEPLIIVLLLIIDLTAGIQDDTVQALMHIRAEQKVEREQVAKAVGTNRDDSVTKAPVKRAEVKIYPNSPCPCGSGKSTNSATDAPALRNCSNNRRMPCWNLTSTKRLSAP